MEKKKKKMNSRTFNSTKNHFLWNFLNKLKNQFFASTCFSEVPVTSKNEVSPFSPGNISPSPFSPPAVAATRYDRYGANTGRCLQRIRDHKKRSPSFFLSFLATFWAWLEQLDPNLWIVFWLLFAAGCFWGNPGVYTCQTSFSHPVPNTNAFWFPPFSPTETQWTEITLPLLRASALSMLNPSSPLLPPCLRPVLLHSGHTLAVVDDLPTLLGKNKEIVWSLFSNNFEKSISTFGPSFPRWDLNPQLNSTCYVTNSSKLTRKSESQRFSTWSKAETTGKPGSLLREASSSTLTARFNFEPILKLWIQLTLVLSLLWSLLPLWRLALQFGKEIVFPLLWLWMSRLLRWWTHHISFTLCCLRNWAENPVTKRNRRVSNRTKILSPLALRIRSQDRILLKMEIRRIVKTLLLRHRWSRSIRQMNGLWGLSPQHSASQRR